MNIDIFSYTDMGSRSHNEDYYGIRNEVNRCSVVLCDGLGGHNCGEVASKNATESIMLGIDNMEKAAEEEIYLILQAVNDSIIKQQIAYPSLNGMRTTTVGCIFEGRNIHYFNVGDSRFYLFRNGALKYMTKDHSVSQMSVELGEKSFADIRGDSDRNKLLKVLGEAHTDNVGTIYKSVPYMPGDAFLLCSDGFWEYVLEDEMEIDLSKSGNSEEWVKYMLVRLFLRMNGENDNYSVIGGMVL